jgi:hypothetical protein
MYQDSGGSLRHPFNQNLDWCQDKDMSYDVLGNTWTNRMKRFSTTLDTFIDAVCFQYANY